jgi:hypothetical protein
MSNNIEAEAARNREATKRVLTPFEVRVHALAKEERITKAAAADRIRQQDAEEDEAEAEPPTTE